MLSQTALIGALLWWLIPGTLALFDAAPDATPADSPTHDFQGYLVAIETFLILAALMLGKMGTKSLCWSIRGEPEDYG